MGARELEIIAKARDTLNDTDENNYRWSQKKLMEHLTDAQDDMCRELPLIVERVSIITNPGTEKYFLPPNTVRALSAMSGGVVIPFISAEELDERSHMWEESKSSKYTEIVVNQLSQFELRPYPLMTESQTNTDNLTIKVRYSAMPIALGWDDVELDSEEELVISEMWDFALRHYVIAMSFLDYGDESNLQRSQASAGLYASQVTRARKLVKKGFAKRVVQSAFQGRVASDGNISRKGQRNGR